MAVADKLSDGGLVSLPPEAGDIDAPVFHPNDEWMRSAPPEHQKVAMWRWFATRYVDPREATPHDRDGEFLYTEGRPAQADQVLQQRFAACVPAEVIAQLLQVMHDEVGNEWAPKPLDKTGS